MRIIDLARKDLAQIIHDWKSALFLVVMPILFTLFFGFVFRMGESGGDPRLPVGLVDNDGTGSLATDLQDLLSASELVRPVLLDAATDVDAQVRDGDLAAVIVVPAGFTAHAFAGEAPPLTIVADRSTTAGQTAHSGIETAALRLLGAVETARISADAYASQADLSSETARQAYMAEAVDLAIDEWRQPALRVVTEKATRAIAGTDPVPSGFRQSSPGMMVQFAVFGLITSAMVLVLERKSGALQRLLTAPVGRATVIGGHVLAMFAVIFFQQALLVVVGQLVFGVNYLQAPVATLVMMAALSLWAASLGLLIGALSRKEEQVITWSLIAMFLFAALGGAWFPLEVAGSTFAAIGHVMPTAWAMDGLQNIVVRGQGLSTSLLPAGVLFAYAAAFFGIGVWRFRFSGN
ncbi:MAG: ABC transporter permease [Anaerolineae bacterium]|jgi:ABC-2 type transport system permease protein